jgi:hypothetical protein
MLGTLAVFWAVTAAPTYAAEYFGSYTSSSGTPTTASLYFTTSDTLNAVGGYDILGMHGDVNGDAITGVEANPNQPHLSLSATRAWNFDNVLYNSGPLLSTDGVVFTTIGGLEYNMWSDGGTKYTLKSVQQAVGTNGKHASGPASQGNMTTSTPSAPPPPAPPSGQPSVLTFEDARTYSSNLIATQGYQFSSTGCCEFTFGNTAVDGGADNHTKRISYTLDPVVMTAVDGSAFDVTSLDAGVGNYFTPGQNYSMLLTGVRADGSQVTTSLGIDPSFHNYALSGFTDLVSLSFGHPGGGFYLTFDNIAVGPASPAPELSTWAMMLAGFGAIGGAMRARRPRRDDRHRHVQYPRNETRSTKAFTETT